MKRRPAGREVGRGGRARPGLTAGAAVLALLSACAPRVVEVPVPVAPRFPDFVYPTAPDGLGTPAARTRHEEGWRWLQGGELRAAEKSFGTALKQPGGFYPAEAGLGYVAMARKDYRDAVGHFDRALGANASYVPALIGRGDALLAIGQHGPALESFEAALAVDASLAALKNRVEVLRLRSLQDNIAAARKAAEAGRLPEARAAYRKALAASPESAFLFRELAAVEWRAGGADLALEHARRAAELDTGEARAHVLMADVYESRGEWERAADALATALTLDSDAALEARLEEVRARMAFAAMPPEYQAIESTPVVTRAQLAALVAVRLEDLVKRSSRRPPVVITDTRGSWAAPWIQAVARAGIMEVYPNHTFQPNAPVRRADLAQAVSRTLTLIAAEQPHRASAWRNARRRFSDLQPGHLTYPAASLAVEAGVMSTFENDSFQLTREVTGAEAVEAIRRVEELAAARTQ